VTSPWLTNRQLAIVAIFSALWAAIEILLGTLMVMLQMPFRGAILTGIALVILIMVRKMVPKRGTAIAMAVVVAIIRVIMGGPKILTIAPALIIEGALIEAALVIIPGNSPAPNQFRCITAGILAVTYSFVHTILMVGLLAGIHKQNFSVVIEYLESLRFGEMTLWMAMIILVLAHAAVGIGAGVLSWRFSRRISQI
jgi:ABC-type thiamin/hydroxymethylpyrimidine transport system permease subunit